VNRHEEAQKNPANPKNPEVPKIIRGISIASPPELTYYTKNQVFDPRGLTVLPVYGRHRKRASSRHGLYSGSRGYLHSRVKTDIRPRRNLYRSLFYHSGGSFGSDSEKPGNDQPPAKTTYELGEDFSLDGLVITGTYSDGMAEPMDHNLIFISGYDKKTGPPNHKPPSEPGNL
jgi:hypothetical protein